MKQSENIDGENLSVAEETQLTIGERLRAAREGRDLSLKDVAATTHQSIDVLAAMEAMQTDHMSPTILRLQAGSYADFLGLPSAEIVAGFSVSRGATVTANMPGEKLRATQVETRRKLWPIGLAAAVIVAAGVAFWMFQTPASPRTEAPTATRVIIPPTPSRSAPKPTRLIAAPEISIRANSSAWIEVRGSDGTIFRNRKMSKGEVYYPRMNAAWTVTVRDAGAFEWWLGSHLVGPLGETGVPIYSVSVDNATTLGQEQLSTALADIENASRGPR